MTSRRANGVMANAIVSSHQTLLLIILICRLVHATTVDQPIINCAADLGACTIEFAIDSDGDVHRFDLIREETSVFASDAKVVNVDGKEIAVATREVHGLRFHTKSSESRFATAFISTDGSRLLEGIFMKPDHGFYEFEAIGDPTHRLRRSLRELEDVTLEMPKNTKLRTSTDFGIASAVDGGVIGTRAPTMTDPNWNTRVSSAKPGETIPFYPGCYPEDITAHVAKINIILDYGVVLTITGGRTGDQTSAILSNLESVLSMGKLIFWVQLNVRLEIGKVVLGSPSMPLPLSRAPQTHTCSDSATGTFDELLSWIEGVSQADQTGYWIHASNCFTGVNGVSYIGGFCGDSLNGGVAAYSWPVMFHELGHGFGMSHTFQNGIGTTGGLMDYGDTLYNGVSQFHPYNRGEACAQLTYLKKGQCPFFYRAEVATLCGDGILTSSEQCECMDKSKSCGKCVNCALTDSSIECSSTTFVVRSSTTPSVLVLDDSVLASPQCCIRNKFAPPKTLCGDNQLDACGATGHCVPICTALLFLDNPNCGFDSTGCLLGCMWKNKCRFDMLYGFDNKLISALPDGSACLYNGAKGFCKSSVCVTPYGTSSPLGVDTPAPTRSPFSNEREVSLSPTPRKTKKPTKAPTRKPTKSPVIATSGPSKSPVTDSDPGAHVDLEARCKGFKRKALCKKGGCTWCSNKCQYATQCQRLRKKHG